MNRIRLDGRQLLAWRGGKWEAVCEMAIVK
jgi:hypothetical protein